MKEPLDRAHELMDLAQEDLLAGATILASGQALRAACFHAQQAAEKSIKALLSARDLTYPWRHDLKELVGLGLADWSELAPWTDTLDELTPYAVQSRYTRFEPPSQETARQALEAARQFHELIQALLTREEAAADGR
jgi:HEPN domain-containing protein